MAKVVAALALAGTDKAGTSYCDRAVADDRVHNPDGSAGFATCEDKRAWCPLTEVFGKSLNLPLLWRLGQLPPAELEAIAHETGLTLDAGSPPATALVLGLASAAPVDLASLMQAAARGVMGQRAAAVHPRTL